MIDREWWTRQLPLENSRDVYARVCFRFLWVTAPVCIISYLFSSQAITHYLAVYAFFIPIGGGAIDWWHLRKRSHRVHPAAA